MIVSTEPADALPVAAAPRVMLSPLHMALSLAFLAAWYIASGIWGLSFSASTAGCTLIWPPSGIALAAIILLGPRVIPVIYIAAVIVNHVAVGSLATPWPMLVGIGNTLEAVVGWYTLTRIAGFDPRMGRLSDAVALVFIAVPLSPIPAALLGAASTCAGGEVPWSMFWHVATTWYVGDAISILLLTPVLLTWFSGQRYAWKRTPEALVMLLLVLGTTAAAFSHQSMSRADGYPLAFLPMPLVVWGAMRFGPRGASLLSLTLSCVAVIATLMQRGPFYLQDIQESVRLLWAFMAVVGGTAVCLSSAAAESRRVQANLKQSRDRYQLLMQGAGVLAWEADPATLRFTYVSGQEPSLLGYSPQQWCAEGFWERAIHPDDREATVHACAISTRKGEDHVLEYRMVAAEGTVHWVHDVVSVAAGAGGRPMLRGLMIDVTERKAAQGRVEAAERKFRSLFEQSPWGVMIIDPASGRILEVNAALADLLGYAAPESVTGITVADLDAVRTGEETARKLEQIRSEGSMACETRWKRRDGAIIDVMVGVRTTAIAGRTVFHCIVRDITRQRLDAAALVESEQRFRDMFERHDSVMLLVEHGTGQVLDGNHAACRFYGYTREELRGMHISRINRADPALIHVAMQQAGKGMKNSFEFTHRLKNGEDRLVEIHSSPIQHQGRTLLFSIIHDITQRKRIEAERDSLQQQIIHAQKLESLGVMAGGVAHDFNNLLVGVLGNAGLARRMLPEQSPARTILNTIEQAAQRAADLTRQLLAYAGKGRLQTEVLDLSSLVLEMSRILQVSLPPNANVKLDIAAGLPSIEVDATQVRQVTMNLLTNAADSLEGGPGHIRISTGTVHATREYLATAYVPSDAPEGEYVFLEVADTGKGMDRATMLRIFDPFFTTKFTGRGLGLAAALGIVRGHRGAVKVLSEPGKGTTFRILFPVCSQPASQIEAKPDATVGIPDALAVATIMVVDDERIVREFARDALTTRGYQVIEAADGQEALGHLRERGSTIAAILLDVTMPGISGHELLWTLREMGIDSPVILSSGYSEPDALNRVDGVSDVSFIQKPYTHELLLDTVATAVTRWQQLHPTRKN
jgi:PAS domain S-box-containing protein